jgi:hypothetical protein
MSEPNETNQSPDAALEASHCVGAESPPPTAEQLLKSAVEQLTIDCEADACTHKRRGLEQSRAAVKSLNQSAIERDTATQPA